MTEKEVIIKPEAYYKMLLHVLRFGNKVRDRRQFREVMGILIGRLVNDPDKKGVRDVIIEDAVPISHGGAIEVAFAPEDYVTFSMVDASYAEKNWFSCGWYHSHPNLDIFFSSTDIRNQLGWQTPNPSAIGIVFDHTHLETPGDLGFRTFRLDNPAKGQMSGYHEVKTTVVPPDNIEYYIKLIELINATHSKEAPILEINELPDLFGDIAFPNESQIFVETPELNTDKILSNFKTGLLEFLELSIGPLILLFNSWANGMIKKILNNNLQMRKDVITIKNGISEGISKMQKDFKFSLKEKLNELDMYIDDKFEKFDSDLEFFKDSFNKIKKELEEQINLLFNIKLKENIDVIINLFNTNIEKLTEVNNSGQKSSENLDKNINIVENLSKTIDLIAPSSIDKLNSQIEDISAVFTKNINKSIGNFINQNKDAKSFVSDLKAAIILLESSKNPIQNKLDTLEIENKTLQKSISELKMDNEKLLNKIKTLEKGEE